MMTGSAPFVSIIVPTFRRPEALDRCLASLARQRYPQDRYEVVVADDAGDDGLADVCGRHAMSVALVRGPHGGPAAARNRAADSARGEILAFIDDDCTADEGWVAALVGALESDRSAIVGGQVTNAVPDNPYARASQTLLSFLYRYYHQEGRGFTPFFTTNNLAVHRDTFARLRGFDPGFTFASEDRDWSDRARALGYPLRYVPGAIVHHAPQLTFSGFVRLHYAYGKGAWLFHRVRAQRGGGRFRVEPVAFYTRMIGAPFTHRDPQPWRQSLLLLVSQAIGALGYAHAALLGGERDTPLARNASGTPERELEGASHGLRDSRPDDAQA